MSNEFATDGVVQPAAAPAPLSEAEAENVALNLIAESNPDSFDASEYIAERKDQDAAARLDPELQHPARKRARLERYQRALGVAQQTQPQQSQNYSPPPQDYAQQPPDADYEQQVQDNAYLSAKFDVKSEEYFSKAPEAKSEIESTFAFQPLNREAAMEIARADHGPMIAHALAKDWDALEQFRALPPAEQARWVSKWDGQAAAITQMQQTAPPPRSTSRAPPPLRPVSGGASPGIDPNKTDMASYVKWRRAQNAD